jgi:hypothetical protein
MPRRLKILLLLLSFLGLFLQKNLAQDSIVVKIHPSYGHANGLHKLLLGENYRREWSMEVRVPILHL